VTLPAVSPDAPIAILATGAGGTVLRDHLARRLPHEDFIRIHRSYIISLRKVDTVSRKAVLLGDTELPCSEHYRNVLYSIIGEKL